MEMPVRLGFYPAKMIKHTKQNNYNHAGTISGANKHQTEASAVLESMSDGFVSADADWKIVYWNKQAEKITKIPREEILGKNLWEMFPDMVNLKFNHEYHKALAENVPTHFTEYYPPLNVWLEMSAFPLNGGLSIYFLDCTERVKAVELAKKEEQKYKDLFNLSPLPQWVFDVETLCFLDVNEAAVLHYGFSKAEFLKMTIKDIRVKEDHDTLAEMIGDCTEEGCYYGGLVRHNKKNGEILTVKVESNAISFEGKIARLVLAIDVTEKLRSKQELEESINRFNIVSKATSDVIWDWDIKTDKIVFNKGMKGIFGYDLDQADNSWFNRHVHPDDLETLINDMKVSIATKEAKSVSEYRFRCADGIYKYVQDRSFLLFDPTGEPVRMIGSMQDMTESINYIRDIEEQNSRLKEISWMQSHHVRAPLARILGLTDLITTQLDTVPESDQLVAYLQQSARELDLIIRDIVKKTEGL
jgi:PAS domain S-box-containing protein